MYSSLRFDQSISFNRLWSINFVVNWILIKWLSTNWQQPIIYSSMIDLVNYLWWRYELYNFIIGFSFEIFNFWNKFEFCAQSRQNILTGIPFSFWLDQLKQKVFNYLWKFYLHFEFRQQSQNLNQISSESTKRRLLSV